MSRKSEQSLIGVSAGRDADVEIGGDVVGGDKTAPEQAQPEVTQISINWKSFIAPLVSLWTWLARLFASIKI